MEILIKDLKKHGKFNTFTLTVEQYWGDGDGYDSVSEDFKNDEKGLKKLSTAITALDKFKAQCDVETPNELERSRLFTSLEKIILEELIKVDHYGETLYSIQSWELQYFDESGHEREVEIKH